jgi:hypothetical protein
MQRHAQDAGVTSQKNRAEIFVWVKLAAQKFREFAEEKVREFASKYFASKKLHQFATKKLHEFATKKFHEFAEEKFREFATKKFRGFATKNRRTQVEYFRGNVAVLRRKLFFYFSGTKFSFSCDGKKIGFYDTDDGWPA